MPITQLEYDAKTPVTVPNNAHFFNTHSSTNDPINTQNNLKKKNT